MMSTLASVDWQSVIASNLWVVVALAFVGFMITGVAMENLRKGRQVREREETKREIAAYVAEGTMTIEDADRILASGSGKGGAPKKNACA